MTPTPFPVTFEQVHVVSDLHLGGLAGFQIFGEGPALAAYIRGLIGHAVSAETAQAPRPAPRCLVINGDFVDFLAESPSRHFDPLNAVAKLERIAGDAAFAQVFQALSDFLAWPGGWLGVVLGNHDVELALPWVRERLLDLLTKGMAERRGRVLFSLQGEGLLLKVAGSSGPTASVMCVHGNEVDGWNVVEHEVVRRMGRDAQRGQTINEDWIPNAGSRMVVEVMNDVKKDFPFVDLLKPENKAVTPIMLALRPSMLRQLDTLAQLGTRQALDGLRERFGWLGDEPGRAADAAESRTVRAEQVTSLHHRRQDARRMADALLDAAEERLGAEVDPLDLIAGDERRDYLGKVGVARAALRGDTIGALMEALEELDSDRSFLTFNEDATYRDLRGRVSSNIDFLVAGHTHLARAIERERGRSWYFNSGTWARVFRIPDPVRRSRQRFAALFDHLKIRDVTALDKVHAGAGKPYLGDEALLERVAPHVVVVRADVDKGNRRVVAGELHQLTAPQTGGESAATQVIERFERH